MIVEHLNSWYAQYGNKDKEPHRVRPSNLADCLRKHAWLLHGLEPVPLTPETVRTFQLGNQRGQALEEACKAIWTDAQSQVPITIPMGRFELTGTVDLWIPSLRTILDFKTQATFGYGLLATEGVSEDYQLQVHAYREGISRRDGREVGFRNTHPMPAKGIRAFIVYEAKDSDARKGIRAQELKELEVPWTQELEERYQKRLLELEGMLIRKKQGTLDPRAYPELPRDAKGQKSWKCRYCSVGEDRGECYRK